MPWFLAMATAQADPLEPRVPIIESAAPVLELSRLTNMASLLDVLAQRRVIFLGEVHDRYEDHLAQIAIVHGLRARGVDLAIGVEWFRQSDQPALDAYLAGRIDERTLLRRTDYFRHWGYDVRLYRPILQYARQFGVALIGLNLDRSLIDQATQGRSAALTSVERARLPQQIAPADAAYRARLHAAFERHPHGLLKDFERFVQVQLLWDEGMAKRAAAVLADDPQLRLVVLAGSGHLEYGQGIPQRLLRRVPVSSAIVLNGRDRAVESDAADYYIYPQPVALPPTGRLGVMLAAPDDGGGDCAGVVVSDFAPSSSAVAAGLERGDCILAIDGQALDAAEDLPLALLDRAPGESVELKIRRTRSGQSAQLLLGVVLSP